MAENAPKSYEKPRVKETRQVPKIPGPLRELSDQQIEHYAGEVGEKFPDITDSESVERHLREAREAQRGNS